jgi:NADP-reducing hydrogenase subunit HndB
VEKKITSPADLKALRDKALPGVDLRTRKGDLQVVVHMGTCGIAAGARDVLGQVVSELAQPGTANVVLKQTGCLGLCDQEPMMTITDKAGKEFRYGKLDRHKVHEIIQEHVLGGKPVIEHIITY